MLYVCDLVGELLGGELDIDVESIGIVLAVYDDLVVRSVTFFEEYCFDLAREYVDASDDHHVVASAQRLGHLDMGAAAGAFLPGQDADVLGARRRSGPR